MAPNTPAPAGRPGPGPIEAGLQGASSSFVDAGRLAALLPAALLAPLAAPAHPVAAALAALFTTATATGVWLTSRREVPARDVPARDVPARDVPGRVPARVVLARVALVVDVGWLLAIGLLQPELVGASAAQSGASLVYIAIQMALIAYAVQLPPRWLALLVPALLGSYLLGSLRMPVPDVAGWTVWLVAVTLLALGVRTLLFRVAAGTDRALRAQYEAFRSRALAAGRRADEQSRLTVLHDTVAATLLMVGSGTVRRDAGWLRAQARRDLAVLTGPELAAPVPDTLGRLLVEVAAEGPLHAEGRLGYDVDPAVRSLPDVPPAVLAAVAGAVREALTNVRRHAGDSATARLAAGPTVGGGFWVLVTDTGAGFEPAGTGHRGRGLRESVLGRCREAGVDATARSSPGAGSQIRLTWPGPVGRPEDPVNKALSPSGSEPGPLLLAQRLRLGVLLVPLVLFGVLEPAVVAEHRELYTSAQAQYAVLLVLVGVVLVAGLLEVTGRPGRRTRPVLLAVAGAAVLTSVHGLLPDAVGGAAHWSLTDTGWVVCVVLSRSRPWVVVTGLATGVLLNLSPVLLGAGITRPAAVNFVTLAAGIVAIQLAVALSGRMVAGWAESAQRAAERDAAMATREEVAVRVHADRARHYQELGTRIEPLLHGLADGSLDPEEQTVQRACALEAARLRRLFAENDDVAVPLLHELRVEADVAERRGIAVHLVVRGEVPALDLPLRRALIDPVSSVLAAASSRARITVFGQGDGVAVSVLADVPAEVDPLGHPQPDPLTAAADPQGLVEVGRIRGAEGFWLNLEPSRPAVPPGTATGPAIGPGAAVDEDPDVWVVRATPPDLSPA